MSEIHTTPAERLVTMANQIAKAFAAQGEARAVQKTAEHIKAFWDPRMRNKIDEHIAAGGDGLETYALAALKQLKTDQGQYRAARAGFHAIRCGASLGSRRRRAMVIQITRPFPHRAMIR